MDGNTTKVISRMKRAALYYHPSSRNKSLRYEGNNDCKTGKVREIVHNN